MFSLNSAMIALMKIRRAFILRSVSIASLACLCLVNAGCFSSYRVEIQQGNVISAEQIEKLIPGTPRDEVRFILGTPLIEDPFHAQRWDYFYSLDPAKGEKVTQYRLSIWFEDEKIARTLVEGAGLQAPYSLILRKTLRDFSLTSGTR